MIVVNHVGFMTFKLGYNINVIFGGGVCLPQSAVLSRQSPILRQLSKLTAGQERSDRPQDCKTFRPHHTVTSTEGGI